MSFLWLNTLFTCEPFLRNYSFFKFLWCSWSPSGADSHPSFRHGHCNTLFPGVFSDSPDIGADTYLVLKICLAYCMYKHWLLAGVSTLMAVLVVQVWLWMLLGYETGFFKGRTGRGSLQRDKSPWLLLWFSMKASPTLETPKDNGCPLAPSPHWWCSACDSLGTGFSWAWLQAKGISLEKGSLPTLGEPGCILGVGHAAPQDGSWHVLCSCESRFWTQRLMWGSWAQCWALVHILFMYAINVPLTCIST